MQYQFQVDNRPAGPVRDKWEPAAHDAVAAGYAVWVGGWGKKPSNIRISNGGAIARVQ